VRQLRVFAVRANTIRGLVRTPAECAQLTYTGTAGEISASATITVTGKDGAASFTLAQHDDLDDVAEEINQQSHKTGVTAQVSGNNLVLETVDYGTAATIEVDVNSGTFNLSGGNGDRTAQGVDAIATINDETLTGDGNRFTYNRNGLRFAIEFQGGFEGAFSAITVRDSSVARFALSTRSDDIEYLALPGLQTAQLGGLSGRLDQLDSGGTLSGLGDNTSQAIRVVNEALSQLSQADGVVNGFADQTIASSAALLSGISTSITDTLQVVNGIDEDEESLLIAKNQQLAENALTSLGLLADQRASIVALLKTIAGTS
jgi:Flagellin hook IN motif